jgi:hypothetical protein
MQTFLARWREGWNAVHEEQSDWLDRIPPRWTRSAVFTASALTLYVELVLVRWHATCFHAFAIFKNVSLLSCFLGLGIGYGLSGKRRSTLAAFLPLLALQTLLFGVLSCTNLGGRRINPVAEQMIMGTPAARWGWLDAVEGNAFLASVFALNAVMFIPLGQLAGRLMGRLPRVPAYSLNLLGSLTGIAVFSALSLLWTPPGVWMAVAVLGLAPFLAGGGRLARIGVPSLAVILLALGLVGQTSQKLFYSPYQVISLNLPLKTDPVVTPTIKVNHCFYQDVWDCSAGAVAAHPEAARAAAYYDLPYRLQADPGDVLVVGAGSGNDVAAALRHGCRSVTAVEIDPAIYYLGERLHPERPYRDPRTRAVVNDARTFLRETDEHFDTIIYGLLDSHTNLGAMTNVRLDSFVYTVQGFRDAVSRLKGTGLVIVSYVVLDPRQADKLYAMLAQAYPDQPPRVFGGTDGTHYVTGPGLKNLPETIDGLTDSTAAFLQRGAARAEVATDDWPFFYMQQRTYPLSYAVMILVLLGLSAWLVKRHLGTFLPVSDRRGAGFFFLGAGFMLIETKGITELGLVFGNTWQVMSVVLAGILLMVYLANQWVQRRGPVPQLTCFVLLGATLALGWVVNRLGVAGVVVPGAKLILPLVLTLPLFFAGLIFSGELARGGEIGPALGANLFGAMLGGFLEYNSMYWGFSSLYPLGMALYAAAYFAIRSATRAQEPETAAPAVRAESRAA